MSRAGEHFDVAVVGGGPAGSSVAIRLARRGLRVVLFEKKRFPRAKLCGEFVSPECVAHLADLGVMARLETKAPVAIDRTFFYSRSGKSIAVESEWFGGRKALGISRAAMDDALLAAARDAAVDVRQECSIKRVEDSTLETTTGETLAARIIIDGTGRGSRFVERKAKRANHVAFKAHLEGAAIDDGVCEIYSYDGGYGGCNSVEGNVANLCFIASADHVKNCDSDPERVMRDVLCKNRRAAKVLKNAIVVTNWLAVPITSFGRGNLVPAPNMLAVGDAASFIDPFTGSGILMALQSGKIAAEAIASDRTFEDIASEYEQHYAAAFDKRLRVSSMLRHASTTPRLADAVIAALSVSTALRRRLALATRGDAAFPVKIDT